MHRSVWVGLQATVPTASSWCVHGLLQTKGSGCLVVSGVLTPVSLGQGPCHQAQGRRNSQDVWTSCVLAPLLSTGSWFSSDEATRPTPTQPEPVPGLIC